MLQINSSIKLKTQVISWATVILLIVLKAEMTSCILWVIFPCRCHYPLRNERVFSVF